MGNILAVDVGNTHIEIGLYDNETLVDSWRIATGVHRTEDELMSFIHVFLGRRNRRFEDIRDLAIASVVPNITQIFTRMSEKYLGRAPFVADGSCDTGMPVDYNPPSSVGADRICNAVAAYNRYGGPAVVVDFGTATTLDVVSVDGVYLGGLIAPGLETASWGLHERASKLPRISYEFPATAVGKTTEHSMQAGIMLGAVKMIDGLIELVADELGQAPVVVATGGLSRLFAGRSRYIEHVEPDLVLQGLMRIYRRNRPLPSPSDDGDRT